MRHRNSGSKLGRQPAHRRATLRNLVTNLFEHGRITTTLTRAKAARPVAEKIITLGKRGGLSNVRLAERRIRSRDVLQKVFGELKDRYADRPGGYTRIVRLGFRLGDAAQMALLELVDRPESAGETTADDKPEAKAAPKAKAKDDAAKAKAKDDTPKAKAKDDAPKAKAKDDAPKGNAKDDTSKGKPKADAPKADAEAKPAAKPSKRKGKTDK